MGALIPIEHQPTVFEPLRLEVQPGHTLAELVRLANIPEVIHDRVVLLLNGQIARDWEHTFTCDGDTLTIAVVPEGGGDGGGKQIFAAVAMLAITIAAPYLASAAMGAGFGGATAVAAAKGSLLLHSGITMGISLVGALAISALVPPPQVASGGGLGTNAASPDESPTYSLHGQGNNARLYSTVKRVYGSYRVFPDLATTPLIDNIGKTSQISGLYYFSAGDCDVEDMRFGDLPFDTFEPAFRLLENSDGSNLKYVHRSVGYDELSYTLSNTQWLRLQTKVDAIRTVVDFTFPRGLVRMERAMREPATVPLQMRWRKKNTSRWTYLGASNFYGASARDDGGETYTAEYQNDPIHDDPNKTAWVYQTDQDPRTVEHRIKLYRNGQKIYERKFDPEDFPSGQPTVATAGGVTYRPGATMATGTSNHDKQEVYSELLVATPIEGNAVRISNDTREPFTVAAAVNFPEPGVYEVEVQRTTTPAGSDAIADDVTVTLLKSFAAGPVLRLNHRATMLEMQVTATDQLRGSVPPINALVTSRLRDFNADGWRRNSAGAIIKQRSSNQALIAIDLLTGEGCRFPLRESQIDWPSFNRLKAICDEVRTQTVNGVTYTGPRFEWNGVIETSRPLGDAVNAVLGTARAQLRFTSSGKIGVLIDEEQTQPRALITPANSWGFSGSRPFPQQPDALRINFTDEERDFIPASVVVYNTGKSASNAEIYEDLDAWGVTSYAEAWRYGRYMLKQGILRSETFSVSMDAENLVVQRGELVTVQHDVPLHGGMAARVTEVDGAQITIDREFDAAPTGYVNRDSDGVVTSGAIVGIGGPATFTVAAGHSIATGHLIVIGELDRVTQDYLVRSIDPGEDYSARLSLVKYDAEVYSDEAGALPVWDPGFGEDLITGTSIVARNFVATQAWTYDNRYPTKQVNLSWTIAGNVSAYRVAVIEWRYGTATWQPIEDVYGGVTEYTHNISWEDRALWNEEVEYRVRPLSSIGNEGIGAETTLQLTAYELRPQPPRNAFLDVRGEEISLKWDFSVSPDVANYVVRFTPDLVNTTWHEATPLATLSWDQDQLTFGARTGTYLLRAINYSGLPSTVVRLRTTIEHLPDLNVVATLDESGTLGATLTPEEQTNIGLVPVAERWPGPVYRFSKGEGYTITMAPVRTLEEETIFVISPDYMVETLEGTEVDIHEDLPWGEDYLLSDTRWDPATTQDRALYTMEGVLDLGAIFEVRLQALHKAFALQVDALAEVAVSPSIADGLSALDADAAIDWNCWMEYRAASDAQRLEDWPALNTLPALGSYGVDYGPWRKFNTTTATLRWLEMRIVAESEQDNILIVVTEGRVEIDMPDRTSYQNNIVIPANGITINFNPPFAAVPAIAVTIEGATEAIRYEAQNVSRTSVDVALYDANGVTVPGQIDLAAMGYGRERQEVI